jgi:hypothetical protein
MGERLIRRPEQAPDFEQGWETVVEFSERRVGFRGPVPGEIHCDPARHICESFPLYGAFPMAPFGPSRVLLQMTVKFQGSDWRNQDEAASTWSVGIHNHD